MFDHVFKRSEMSNLIVLPAHRVFTSKVNLIVGQRGSGKSTFNKKIVQHLPRERLRIHDIQGEYFPGEALTPVKEFIEQVQTCRNCVILFEEATIFFPNRGYDKGMVELLVSARHRGNIINLVYHSITAIPEYIYNLADYIVLFETKDKIHKIELNYEELAPHVKNLRERPEACLKLKLYNGKISPFVIVEL